MADPFADWYVHQLAPVVAAGYTEDGTPTPEQLLDAVPGQMRRSSQLVRDPGGQEVVSSGTFACSVESAEAFTPGGQAFSALHGTMGVITVAINDADPVLAGATIYLS